MKLKILIVPVALIIAVIATAGIILPKALETKDAFGKLKKAEQDLSQTADKIDKSNKLTQELTANTGKQNILLRYIPIDKQEEGVINNLDAVASAEGLVIIKLSPVSAVETAASMATAKSEEEVSGGSSGSQLEVNKIKTTDVNMMVVGSYEKIRSFLEKLDKMQRFNDVASLKISRVMNNENPDPNNLQAEIVLGFGYLNRVTVASVNSEILNSGRFDMSAITKITDKATTNFSEISIGQTGKTNPFLP
jgi:Tfp pilus assembly protein PilO